MTIPKFLLYLWLFGGFLIIFRTIIRVVIAIYRGHKFLREIENGNYSKQKKGARHNQ